MLFGRSGQTAADTVCRLLCLQLEPGRSMEHMGCPAGFPLAQAISVTFTTAWKAQ
jgi:hypothetical protein